MAETRATVVNLLRVGGDSSGMIYLHIPLALIPTSTRTAFTNDPIAGCTLNTAFFDIEVCLADVAMSNSISVHYFSCAFVDEFAYC